MRKIIKGYISVALCIVILAASIVLPINTFSATAAADPIGVVGDVDGDGVVTGIDFAMMKQYLFGDIKDFPVVDDLWAGDVDGSGTIDALDFALMKQYLLKSIRWFPKEQPTVPSELSASDLTDTGLTLSWTSSSGINEISRYEVKRQVDNNTVTFNASGTSYNDTGLKASTSYTYTIVAIDIKGRRSEESSPISITTKELTKPENLECIEKTDTTATLSWESPKGSIGIKEYYIYSGDSKIASTTGTTSYVVTGLMPGVTYSFYVKAQNIGGSVSEASNTVCVVINVNATPPSPLNVCIQNQTETSVTVKWDAPVNESDIEGYRIFRDNAEIGSSTGTSYTDEGLKTNTTYYYTVKSIKNDLLSKPSEPLRVTLISIKTVSILKCTSKTDKTVELSWIPFDADIKVSGYEIYRNDINISTVTGLSYRDTCLEPDVDYTYKIVAVDKANGVIYESNVINVNTNPLPNDWIIEHTGTSSSNGYVSCSNGSYTFNTSQSNGMLYAYKKITGNFTLVVKLDSLQNVSGSAIAGIYVKYGPDSNYATASNMISPSDISTSGYKYLKTVVVGYTCRNYVSKDGVYWETRTGQTSFDDSKQKYVGIATQNCDAVFSRIVFWNDNDTQEPSQPGGLSAIYKNSSVDLKWSPSTDNVGVMYYKVYCDGYDMGIAYDTSFTVDGLDTHDKYIFTIKAFDYASNSSTSSLPVTLLPGESLDVLPPVPPTVISMESRTKTSITIKWSGANDNIGVTGYDIYRNSNRIASTENTYYEDTGLNDGALYSYYIIAKDAIGNPSIKSKAFTFKTVSASDNIPPTTPSGVKAVVKNFSVDLTWTESTDNVGVAKYVIYRNNIAIGTTTATNYTDSDLLPDTSYLFTIEAYDLNDNCSSASEAVSFTTVKDDYGDYFSISYIKQDELTPVYLNVNDHDFLTFKPESTRKYIISSTGSGPIMLAYLYDSWMRSIAADAFNGGLGNLYIPFELEEGNTYYIRLFCNNSTDTGKINVIVSTFEKLATPQNLQVVSETSNSRTISWTAPISNVEGYNIYRNGVNIATSSAISYTDVDFTGDKNTYTVRGYDDAGNLSNESMPLTVMTKEIIEPEINEPDKIAPSVVSGLEVSIKSESSLALKWVASTDNIGVEGYKIYRNNKYIGSSRVSSFLDKELSKDTMYSYVVVAYDSAGNYSDISNKIFAYTGLDDTPPTIPSNLQVESKTHSGIVLKWDNSKDDIGVAGYEIYRNDTKIGKSNTNKYADNGLESNTGYKYYVKAYDMAGNYSAQSDILNAWTSDSKDDYGNDFDSAYSLKTDNTVPGRIDFSGDDDYFKIIPDRDGIYTIETTAKFSRNLHVYDENLLQIGFDNNLSSIGLELKMNHKYYIRVSTLRDGSTGDYKLFVYKDTQAPTRPNIQWDGYQDDLITWLPTTDNLNTIFYDVYRNGEKIATTTDNRYYHYPIRQVNGLNSLYIVARDAAGNASPPSNTITMSIEGQTLDKPVGLSASKTLSSVTLTWTTSIVSPSGITYDIYRDGYKIGNTTNYSFTDLNVTSGKTYSYLVVAYQSDRVRSSASDSILVSIDPDKIPPSAPTGLNFIGSASSIILYWTASTDNAAIDYYEIMRDGKSVATVSSLFEPKFYDNAVLPNTAYKYSVRAYDKAGNASQLTTPLSVTTGDFSQASKPQTTEMQISADAGDKHVLATKNDGSLWAWGDNTYGQLGIGSTDSQSNPVQVGTDHDWAVVSAGSSHSVAVKSDGSLWAWGYNYGGQLGDGTSSTRLSPVRIGTSTDWKTASAGDTYTIALKNDGTLWKWGDYITVPTKIGTDKDWVYISAGYYHFMAIKKDGSLWGCGANSYGQLGNGTKVDNYTLAKIGNDNDWEIVSAGKNATGAIKEDGSLWLWGSLPNINSSVPTNIYSTEKYKYVSVGGYYNYATINTYDCVKLTGYYYMGGSRFIYSSSLYGDGFTKWSFVSLGGTTDISIHQNGELFKIRKENGGYVDYNSIEKLTSPSSENMNYDITGILRSYMSAGPNAQVYINGWNNSFNAKNSEKTYVNIAVEDSSLKVTFLSSDSGEPIEAVITLPSDKKEINIILSTDVPQIMENANLGFIVHITNNSDKIIKFTLYDERKTYISDRLNNEIFSYSPTENVYIRRAEWDYFPIETTKPENLILKGEGSASAVIGNKIYITGGCNYENDGYYKTVDVYDVQSGQWSVAKDLNTERTGHGTVELNGRIYAAGGYNGTYLDSIEVYNQETDSWTKLTGKMSSPRADFGMVAFNGKIYAIGGVNETGYLDTVEEYDPDSDEWKYVASMPSKRSGLCTAVTNGKIYIFGGRTEDGDYLSEMDIYDQIADKWTTGPSMLTPRSSAAAATTASNGKIYVIGGWNSQNLGVIEEFNPANNAWGFKENIQIPRHGHCVAAVNEKIYIISGVGDSGYIDTIEVYGGNK